MVYDIVCLTLVVIAFVGGYQNGIVGSFSFFFSIVLSFLITWSVSTYVSDFLAASYTYSSPYLIPLILVVAGLLLTWQMHRLLNRIGSKSTQPALYMLRRVLGGVLLSGLMIFSISIFTLFTEQAHILSQEMRDEAFIDDWMEPINTRTGRAWSHLRSKARGHDEITTSD